MTNTSKTTVRRGVLALAFAGSALMGSHGVAMAQEVDPNYPPFSEQPSEPAPQELPSQPTAVLSGTPDNSPDLGGTLPQTGGPGTTQILLIAGAAVAAGIAVTGVAGRRRNDALDVA